jgi:hypothetical protein
MRYARCNQQIAAKDADVTRSIVQKAVVVLASKPLFGLWSYLFVSMCMTKSVARDKLGIVTTALFNQK